MMENQTTIADTVKNLEPGKLRIEQKQELFEAIRHYLKYQAFAKISDECALPESAHTVVEGLIDLFETHYEGKKHDKSD